MVSLRPLCLSQVLICTRLLASSFAANTGVCTPEHLSVIRRTIYRSISHCKRSREMWFYQYVKLRVVGLWGCRIVGLWGCVLRLAGCGGGTVGLWNCGAVELWTFGAVGAEGLQDCQSHSHHRQNWAGQSV